MPRKNANAIKRVPSVETAKEARLRAKEMEAYYRSYEAELDNLLDEVEGHNEAVRNIERNGHLSVQSAW